MNKWISHRVYWNDCNRNSWILIPSRIFNSKTEATAWLIDLDIENCSKDYKPIWCDEKVHPMTQEEINGCDYCRLESQP